MTAEAAAASTRKASLFECLLLLLFSVDIDLVKRTTMKRVALGLLLALTVASPAWAWGGLFNRFNPSLMSDMYGDSYGRQLFRAAEGGPGRPGAAQV